MTSIKVTYNNIIRKIRVDDTSSWEGVIERLSNVFSVTANSLELTYVDCDNDIITLSTIAELQEALLDDIKTFCLSTSSVNRKFLFFKR